MNNLSPLNQKNTSVRTSSEKDFKSCKNNRHKWLPYNYHQIREKDGFILPNCIDAWTRKCKKCGYVEVTHVIPAKLAKENALVHELTLIGQVLENLIQLKQNINYLKSLESSSEQIEQLDKKLTEVAENIHIKTLRKEKIEEQLKTLKAK